MATLRCPQCGMLNDTDDIGFPRCGQCHEDLVRCGDCKSFEGDACTHPQMHEHYTPDGDAAKTCPAFHSRYEERESRFVTDIPAPIWVALSLLLVLLGLALLAWGIDPAGRYFFGNRLQLALAVPKQVTVNKPFSVILRLANPLDQPSTHIYVEIGEEFLANANAGTPSPHPERIIHVRSQNRLLFGYDPLPPVEQRQYSLPFTIVRRGNIPLVIRLYSPISHLCQEVRTTIVAMDAPKRVLSF